MVGLVAIVEIRPACSLGSGLSSSSLNSVRKPLTRMLELKWWLIRTVVWEIRWLGTTLPGNG